MLSNSIMPKPDELGEQDFMRLLSDHKERLFRLIFCMVRSLEDADDVFQQTSIVLWNKFSEFEPGSNFYLWSSTVARLTSLNFLKAKNSQRVVFSEEFMDELAENDLGESLALRDARLRALAHCREKLSPPDQALLAACYGQERKIIAVAKDFGRPVGSVYDSLSRIRRALYDCIHRALVLEGIQ